MLLFFYPYEVVKELPFVLNLPIKAKPEKCFSGLVSIFDPSIRSG